MFTYLCSEGLRAAATEICSANTTASNTKPTAAGNKTALEFQTDETSNSRLVGEIGETIQGEELSNNAVR